MAGDMVRESILKKGSEHYKIVIFQSCPRYQQIATIQLGDDTGGATCFL
jgi:hypothetical protein